MFLAYIFLNKNELKPGNKRANSCRKFMYVENPSEMITFRNVNKWFGHLHVLNDIDFHVDHGEVVVICGPSGSGKSTLIRCINKLEPIQKGEIVVDNMPIHDSRINIRRLRAEIGFVFQQMNYPAAKLRGITAMRSLQIISAVRGISVYRFFLGL